MFQGFGELDSLQQVVLLAAAAGIFAIVCYRIFRVWQKRKRRRRGERFYY